MARGVKVGNAYIDVNYDVDTAGAIRQVGAFKAIADKVANINASIKVDTKGANFRNTILGQLNKVGDDVDTHSHRWGATVVNRMSRAFDGVTNSIQGGFRRIFKDDSLMRGFDSALSFLPGRLESLFSGKGGPIGLALGMSLLAGVTLVMPALGAMVSGALFSAIGGGAVAAGILLVVKDSRVKEAAGRLKEMFSDKIFDGKGAEAFARVTSAALDRITNALKGWAPIINKMLTGASKFVGPLTAGLIGFVDGFLKPLERVMNSPFMTQIMNVVSVGMAKVGQALGAFFDKFITDSNATEGAVMGLNTMFNLLATGIRMAGDVLIFLSATWKKWNTDGQDGISVMDRIRSVFSFIGHVLGVVGNMLTSILAPAWQLLLNLIRPLIPFIERVAGIIGGILVAAARNAAGLLREMAEWLGKHQGLLQGVYIAIGLLVAGLIVFKTVMIAIRIATLLWAAAQMILNIAMSPVILIILAVVAAIAIIVVIIILVVKHLDFFKNLWNTVWGAVKSFFIDVWNAIVSYVQSYIQLVLLIITTVLNFIKGVWNAAWGWVKEVVTTIWSAIVTAIQFWINLVVTVITTVLGIIFAIWNAIWTTIRDVATTVWTAISNGISAAINFIRNIIVTVMEAIRAVFEAVWFWIRDHIINTLLGIAIFLIQKFIQIKELIQAGLNFIQDVWNAGWTFVKDKVHEIWNNIEGKIRAVAEAIVNFIRERIETAKNNWNVVWGAIKDKVHEIWNDIEGKIRAVADAIANFIRERIDNLKNNWNEVWGAVKDKAHEIWNDIDNKIESTAAAIENFVRDRINNLKNNWNEVWGAVKDKAHEIWNDIEGKIKAAIEAIKNFVAERIDNLKNNWNAVWGAVKDKAHEIWNNVNDKVHIAIGAINSVIHNTLDAIRSKWNDIWEGMKRILGDVWNSITDRVKGGINAVIDILNKGIEGINSVLNKIGISFKIDPIPRLAAGGPVGPQGRGSFAGGGKIRGPGTPTSDSVPILASRDEFMIRAKAAKRIGYKNLAFMNSTGRFPANRRYATGGRVGGNNNSLLDAHRNHVHVAMSVPPMGFGAIIAKAATSGFPFRVSSTFRPGDRTPNGLSHHATGRAVDFGGFNQDGFAGWWEKQAGVIELIHRTNARDYAIFGGKGGGGILSFLNEFLGKGIGWVMDHMVGPAVDTLVNSIPRGSVYGEMARGALVKIKDGLRTKIQEFIDSMSAMESAGGGGRAGAEKWSGVATQALKMLGLPSSWLGPLLTLIGRESGGNPNAVNRTDSNAARGTPSMGLMQTIGPTFNAHKYPGYGNILAPLDNILAGLRYIVSRYGSIFNVQQAVGSTPRGYKNGGWTQRGWNFMHEPELALNSAQGRALERRIAGSDGFSIGELHIHINGPVSESEAKRVGEMVRNELVKLARRNGGKTGLPGS